jgi:hypothetical protein
LLCFGGEKRHRFILIQPNESIKQLNIPFNKLSLLFSPFSCFGLEIDEYQESEAEKREKLHEKLSPHPLRLIFSLSAKAETLTDRMFRVKFTVAKKAESQVEGKISMDSRYDI